MTQPRQNKQFKLWHMFATVTLCALIFGLAFTNQHMQQGSVLLLTMIGSSVIVTEFLHAHNDQRTILLGTATPLVGILLLLIFSTELEVSLLFLLLIGGLVSGIVSAVVACWRMGASNK